MNQNDRIIKHLREKGGLTSAEAISEYGIYRLANRISEIKKDFLIDTKTEYGKNRFGKPTHYARYFLKENIKGENNK